MSKLRRRPPEKKEEQIEEFIVGADKKVEEEKSTTVKQTEAIEYPWELADIRDDVLKVYNLRLPEPYLLKLKYISENTPYSMQKFCLDVVLEAIDREIERLEK